jgi:hypothetical protein
VSSPRALIFATLLSTAFDLYRMNLYDALRLPRPRSPQDERDRAGRLVTENLASRLEDPTVRYRFPPPLSGGS